MAKKVTTIEEVYSDILDNNIRTNLVDSPIWKNCLHKDDMGAKDKKYKYRIKFEGTLPIQLLNIK